MHHALDPWGLSRNDPSPTNRNRRPPNLAERFIGNAIATVLEPAFASVDIVVKVADVSGADVDGVPKASQTGRYIAARRDHGDSYYDIASDMKTEIGLSVTTLGAYPAWQIGSSIGDDLVNLRDGEAADKLGSFSGGLLWQAAGGKWSDPCKRVDIEITVKKPVRQLDGPYISSNEALRRMNQFDTGQGFSAIYNTADNGIYFRPSPNRLGDPIPDGGVQRRGGHMELVSELGGDITQFRGFTIRTLGNNKLELLWNSGLNGNGPGTPMPTQFKMPIVKQVEKLTGMKVEKY